MTKTETIATAKLNATTFANGLIEESLRRDENDARLDMSSQAAHEAEVVGLRNASANWMAFCEEFVSVGMDIFRKRRNELPDVKAARRAESMEYELAVTIKSSKDAFDKFKTRMDESPAYAFEWSDDAFKAAATLDVYTRIQNLIREAGIDQAMIELTTEVLRNAKYGHHSTAAPSNLMAEYKLAAMAGFVDMFRGRGL